MLSTLTTTMATFFTAITSRVSGLLPHHTVVVDVANKPFSVVPTKPVALCNIVEDATELVAAQATTAVFLDGRDNTLHTPDGAGGWTTTPYGFDTVLLRPMTLCFSPLNARLYFVRADHTVLRVNLTPSDPRPTFNVQ